MGDCVSAAFPAQVVPSAGVGMLAVPWGAIDQPLAEVGSLAGNVVVEAANPYGLGPQAAPDQTLAAFDSARRPGARYVRGFDTLTSGFQAQAANRSGDQRLDSSPPHHPPGRDRP